MKTTMPWNKGVAVGQKAPLKHYQVWRIRRLLETEGKLRDLALFSLALDSMLRSSDILRLKVGDICGTHLKPKARLRIQQKKTGKPVEVELSEYARTALASWIIRSGKTESDFLFTRRGEPHGERVSAVRYRQLVKTWVQAIGLNPEDYSTHSLRRTLPSFVYHETKNIEAVRNLLGQNSVTATSRYLNVGGKDSLNVARPFRL